MSSFTLCTRSGTVGHLALPQNKKKKTMKDTFFFNQFNALSANTRKRRTSRTASLSGKYHDVNMFKIGREYFEDDWWRCVFHSTQFLKKFKHSVHFYRTSYNVAYATDILLSFILPTYSWAFRLTLYMDKCYSGHGSTTTFLT